MNLKTLRGWLLRPLWTLLAVLFLIEAWLWDHLGPLVHRCLAWFPWRVLGDRLEARIARFSPWAAAATLVVPAILLFPLKLLGLALLAQGQWLLAIGLLGFAKLLGMGLFAWLFGVCRPALLQLSWFNGLYRLLMRWRDKAHALVDPIRQRLRARIAAVFAERNGRGLLGWALTLRRRVRQRRRDEP